MRAICYIGLTSLWGAGSNDRSSLSSFRIKVAEKLRLMHITNQLIIPDLKIAVSCLEMTPYNNKWGLATKQAAMGMRVRAYLYNKGL